MTTDAKTYLLRAALIIKAYPNLLILPAALGLMLYLPAAPDGSTSSLPAMSLIILFVIMPVIYGQYTELITHNRLSSYFLLFRIHWFNYFVVSLMVGTPILILSTLGYAIGLPFWGLTKIMSVVIDILSIYIFPLVFLTRKKFSCIPLGIKCLFGNLNFSLPLVILVAIPSIVNLFSPEISETAAQSLPLIVLNYALFIVSLFIEFVVFIAAALILKEKLLQS
jgi:hypothetical protein